MGTLDETIDKVEVDLIQEATADLVSEGVAYKKEAVMAAYPSDVVAELEDQAEIVLVQIDVEAQVDVHLIDAAGIVDHQAVVEVVKDVIQGATLEEDAIHRVEADHLDGAVQETDAVIVIKGIDEAAAIKEATDAVTVKEATDVVATKEVIAETEEMAAKTEISALQVGEVLDAELARGKIKDEMVSALVDVEVLLAVVERGKKRNAIDTQRKSHSMISLKRWILWTI